MPQAWWHCIQSIICRSNTTRHPSGQMTIFVYSFLKLSYLLPNIASNLRFIGPVHRRTSPTRWYKVRPCRFLKCIKTVLLVLIWPRSISSHLQRNDPWKKSLCCHHSRQYRLCCSYRKASESPLQLLRCPMSLWKHQSYGSCRMRTSSRTSISLFLLSRSHHVVSLRPRLRQGTLWIHLRRSIPRCVPWQSSRLGSHPIFLRSSSHELQLLGWNWTG